MARDLRAPRGGEPGTLGELEVDRRTDEEALAGERIEPGPVILAQIARFAADKNPRTNLRHHGHRNAGGGFLRPGAGQFRAHGFGLIEQVERRNDAIGNDLPVGGGDEVDAILVAGSPVTSSARPQCGSAPIAKPNGAVARSSNR